jgi:hypothetical protein
MLFLLTCGTIVPFLAAPFTSFDAPGVANRPAG